MTRRGDFKSAEEINAMVEERVPGCEFYGNYTGADGRVDLRCKECGTVFNRSMISVRKGHCSCPTCRKQKNAYIKEARQTYAELKAALRIDIKENNKILQEQREAYKEQQRAIRNAPKPCPVCGKLTTRPKYCSAICRDRANNSTKDARRRKKITNAMVDKDITVMGLFKRDAGVCYLCGQKCNVEDYVIRDGNFIAGDWYPSIDHVVPLSKGGKHSWSNVKLAHRRCNSIKSDKFVEE